MIDKLEDLINKGLAKDVFHAEMNLAVYQKISDNIGFLKTTEPEDQTLFGYLQSSAEIQMVLAVSRLFDTYSYPTRCIGSLLEMIRKNKGSFPEIKDRPNTISCIRAYRPTDEIIDPLIEAISDVDSSVFPNRFYIFYSSEYLDLDEDINSIRKLRDKSISHNEAYDIKKMEDIEHSVVIRLLKFAKEIISVIGVAYLSIMFSGNGVYLLSADALQKSYFIDHLIEKMKKQKV